MHWAGIRKGPNKASKRVAPPSTSHRHDVAANSGPAPRGACHPPAIGTCQAILRDIVTAEDSPSWEELSFLLTTSSPLSHCPLCFPQPPVRMKQAEWHVPYLIKCRGSRESSLCPLFTLCHVHLCPSLPCAPSSRPHPHPHPRFSLHTLSSSHFPLIIPRLVNSQGDQAPAQVPGTLPAK